MSMLLQEIQVMYKNYGTEYMLSTISMHVLCNIDLTVMYVDKVQCNPPPLFFFSFSFKLSLFLDNREN